jgi:hypothetical protein
LYGTDTLINNGTVWLQQGADVIGRVVVDMMDVRMSDGMVAVGTSGNGIYTANITGTNLITGIKQDARVEESPITLYPIPCLRF